MSDTSSDDIFRSKSKSKDDISYNINDVECRNLFMPKQGLRQECATLFEHQGFYMQGLHSMYLSVILELPKESDLPLDPPSPPDCDH